MSGKKTSLTVVSVAVILVASLAVIEFGIAQGQEQGNLTSLTPEQKMQYVRRSDHTLIQLNQRYVVFRLLQHQILHPQKMQLQGQKRQQQILDSKIRYNLS